MHVLVVGLGKSGIAAARFFLGQGARVSVTDAAPRQNLDPDALKYLEDHGVPVEAGSHSEALFRSADRIMVSPGVPLNIPALAAARSRGIPIHGEMDLVRGLIKAPVAAVTGTNGKTTVTTLLGKLFSAAGKKVFVGGNIGTPLFDYLSGPRDAEVVVVEVSSFQLDTGGHFAADVGMLLNITPDHLDRYPSFDAYAESKFRIFSTEKEGTWAILNADDPEIMKRTDLWPDPNSCLFVSQQPKIRRGAYLRGRHVVLTGLPGLTGREEVYDLSGTSLLTPVNMQNAMFAVLAARIMGCPPDDIMEGLACFSPLPHRLTLVSETNMVRYYDDSKATNVGAVYAALMSIPGPIVLIAGGRDKGGDYNILAPAMSGRVKAMLLLGEAKEKMAAALGHLCPFELVRDMNEAVQRAANLARSGDTVLLSPACASFDMFTGYAHRGEVFREAVLALGRP